jgi:two-component system response regulator FixJ
VKEPIVHIIDDDEAVGRALTALTRSAGHDAAAYLSATAFLETLRGDESGCVVTDVRMPVLSGLDLLRELRRRGLAMPVIVMSGQGDIPMAVEALKLGAVDFIEKPFDTAAYLDCVGEALARSEDLARRQAQLASAKAGVAQLTQREREVMGLIVQGFSNFAMASQLGISARTVENHRAKVMEKMAAASLSDLIRMALRLEAG